MKKNGDSSKRNTTAKNWQRTNNEIGHLPDIVFFCPHCHEKMLFRHSHLDNTAGYLTNLVGYKCPECESVRWFAVDDSEEYLEGLREKRGDEYVPSKEVWASESEKIRKKLETLGYI